LFRSYDIPKFTHLFSEGADKGISLFYGGLYMGHRFTFKHEMYDSVEF